MILNKINLPFCCYWSEWTQCPPCLTHFHAKKESRAVIPPWLGASRRTVMPHPRYSPLIPSLRKILRARVKGPKEDVPLTDLRAVCSCNLILIKSTGLRMRVCIVPAPMPARATLSYERGCWCWAWACSDGSTKALERSAYVWKETAFCKKPNSNKQGAFHLDNNP